MDVTISRADAALLIEAARRAHPHECCGLLLGRIEADGRAMRIDRVIETANLAADPRSGFEIDPAALLRVHREARAQARTLLGWYHSHPNGRPTPSPADIARMDEAGRLWLIVAGGALAGFISEPGGYRPAILAVM